MASSRDLPSGSSDFLDDDFNNIENIRSKNDFHKKYNVFRFG